jgi:hypothetical protein
MSSAYVRQYLGVSAHLVDLRERTVALDLLGPRRNAMQEAQLRELDRQVQKVEQDRADLLAACIAARARDAS